MTSAEKAEGGAVFMAPPSVTSGFVYFVTWDSDGSRASRTLRPKFFSGTSVIEVVPGR